MWINYLEEHYLCLNVNMSLIQASVAHLTVSEEDDTAALVHLRSTLPIACSVKLSNGEVQGCEHKFYVESSGKIVKDVIS